MKTFPATRKRLTIPLRQDTPYRADDSIHEAEEEPPGSTALGSDPEKEPPGKTSSTRQRFFGDIPDSSWQDWRWQFRNRITTPAQLSRFLPLTRDEQAQLHDVIRRYPFAVTPYYLSLIDPDDPEDPVRKQAIPSILEITMGMMGQEDPLEERRDSVVPGLVHRYPDRALMVLTDICPMLCRHCTRKREWRGGGWVRSQAEIEAMLDYIRRHPQVRDIIISGGDPLTLATPHLESIISRVRSIPHVEIIRIGSRFPVVLPQRIDAELCDMLGRYGPIWLNTHFNHYREVTPEAAAACDRLLRAGVPVNNQCVLLRGVNDSVETMTRLSHALLRSKVRPYYLFQCDEVEGTEHLRTPVETGLKIIEGMRGHTSGLAVPHFVIDLPHGGGKVPLQPNYVVAQTEDSLMLRNYQGNLFPFRNPGEAARRGVAAAEELLQEPVTPFITTEGARNEDRISVRP
ncbi:MAG: KamA family radical SAM protein [Chloroflexota bacterium]